MVVRCVTLQVISGTNEYYVGIVVVMTRHVM